MVTSTPGEADASNSSEGGVDGRHPDQTESINKEEDAVVSSKLSISLEMLMRLMLCLGATGVQATDRLASGTSDGGLGQNATSSRGVGGWVKLVGKRALDLVVEVSDTFPPLKGVVSGILAVWEVYDVGTNIYFRSRLHF